MRTELANIPDASSRRAEPGFTPAPAPHLIGVGVDGTSAGRDAVVLASILARATGAELMLIAVYEEPLLEGVVPAELGWRSVRRQARTMLARTRDSLAPEARTVLQVNGLVWRGLLDAARREHRDLLVVGSTLHAEHGHATLGDAAAELLSRLECPLAIAPGGMRDDPGARLERIGVAFDATPESEAAVALARSLAFAAGADLRVRQLIDTTPRRATEALQGLCAEVNLLVLGADPSPLPGRAPLARATRKLLNDAPTPILITPRCAHAPAL
jgi:nucleotide-binding universal stress UspA family protein